MFRDSRTGKTKIGFWHIFSMFAAPLVLLILTPALISFVDWSVAHNLQANLNYWQGLGYVVYGDPSGHFLPTAGDNVSDLGSEAASFRNAWIDGEAHINQATVATANITTLNAPTGRGATYVIAASDAPAHVKAQADAIVTTDLGAVINAATSAGYRDIQIGEGLTDASFPVVTSINVVENLELGGKYSATVLTLAADVDMFTGSVVTYNTRIHDLRLNGKNDTRTAGNGFNLTNYHGAFHNIWAENFTNNGFLLTDSDLVRFDNVWSQENSEDGYNIVSTYGSQANMITASQNDGDGFDMSGGGEYFWSNVVSDINGSVGWRLDNVVRSHFTNLWVGDSGGNAMRQTGTCAWNSFENGIIYHPVNQTSVYLNVVQYTNFTNIDITGNVTSSHGWAAYNTINTNWNGGIVSVLDQAFILNDAGNSNLSVRDITISSPNAQTSLGTAKLSNVRGYLTENSGTATINTGSTTAVVTHGLAITPSLQNISITPQGTLGNAAFWWLSSANATSFTINLNADPTTANVTFGWNHRN